MWTSECVFCVCNFVNNFVAEMVMFDFPSISLHAKTGEDQRNVCEGTGGGGEEQLNSQSAPDCRYSSRRTGKGFSWLRPHQLDSAAGQVQFNFRRTRLQGPLSVRRTLELFKRQPISETALKDWEERTVWVSPRAYWTTTLKAESVVLNTELDRSGSPGWPGIYADDHDAGLNVIGCRHYLCGARKAHTHKQAGTGQSQSPPTESEPALPD